MTTDRQRKTTTSNVQRLTPLSRRCNDVEIVLTSSSSPQDNNDVVVDVFVVASMALFHDDVVVYDVSSWNNAIVVTMRLT